MPVLYDFIYLQAIIIQSAATLAQHFDSVHVFISHSGLWVDGRSMLQSLNKVAEPRRKTGGKICFFHPSVMEMDAQ